jgi:hypothetical protein
MAAKANDYPIHIQSVIPTAITTLLNFIHHHGEADFLMDISSRELLPPVPHGDQVPTIGISEEEGEEADWKQDEIAEAVWASYQEILAADSVPEH